MASQHQMHTADLTRREMDVLRLLVEGMSNQEIAQRLVITVNSVKWYNHQIYSILGVRNRRQVMVSAQARQLLDAKDGNGARSSPEKDPGAVFPGHNLPPEATQFIGRQQE